MSWHCSALPPRLAKANLNTVALLQTAQPLHSHMPLPSLPAAAALRDRTLDISFFERVVMYLPVSPSCQVKGRSTLGCTRGAGAPPCSVWMFDPTVTAISREIGHTFGLNHADAVSSKSCTSMQDTPLLALPETASAAVTLWASFLLMLCTACRLPLAGSLRDLPHQHISPGSESS